MKFRIVVLAVAMFAALPPLSAFAQPAKAQSTKARPGITGAAWGTTQRGEKVQIYTLTGRGGMVAKITNFGAVVVDLFVPDRNGKPVNVVLGFDYLASYERGGVYSALIGRYANRLSLKFPVQGKIFEQPAPPPAAGGIVRNYIQHGGANAFHRRVWEAVPKNGPEPSLALTLKDADGTGGFPGNIVVTVTYTVKSDNTIALDYKATTDRPTVMNLTNHFYFSLNGGVKNIDYQLLTLFSSRYQPFDANAMPTGVIASVAGTPYDFTRPTGCICPRCTRPSATAPASWAMTPPS